MIDRGIRLNQMFNSDAIIAFQRTIQRGNYAGDQGIIQTEGITNGKYFLPYFEISTAAYRYGGRLIEGNPDCYRLTRLDNCDRH